MYTGQQWQDLHLSHSTVSFQALDASYPVAERHWPDWLKEEVERSAKLGLRFG
ncbi:MAG TPA: hypothetical protein VFL83_03100 [Anaeromyxobacter sp.]|nr:hypothetical protein [Anaeromyxobacter sp.]